MGAISFTIDESLVGELQKHLPLTHFVETGTFKGETIRKVHRRFERCISIELSEEYHTAAHRTLAGLENITLLLGNSPDVLRTCRSQITEKSTLYWLDAHWCAAEGTAGITSQCPLLAELDAIGTLNSQSLVLIDDARLFLSPPPAPHEISGWPDLSAVLEALKCLSSEHVIVAYNDILIFLPEKILPPIKPFLQQNVANLLTLADKARDFDSLLTQAKEKDREISAMRREIETLHASANERLQAIFSLDAEVKHLRQELADRTGVTAHSSAADVSEISNLQMQLASVRCKLQERIAYAGRLQRELHRYSNRPTSDRMLARKWRALKFRWLSHLATTTPCPLAKLDQYKPRPMRRERFPKSRVREWPRICIITPSYHQARFLERTMLSVCNQHYPNLAYGVQDGGSTDGSVEIISRHIKLLTHAESSTDSGQAAAIRRGFAKLYPNPSDIMGWLNSDDMLMPGALHYIGAYFANHPEVDVIYGHRVVIDEDDHEIGRWFLPPFHENSIRWFDLIPQETMFWRARCYRDVGGVDESFQFAMDWDLLLRFEEAGCNIQRLPYFLACFRSHHEQKTSAKINSVGGQEMAGLRRRIHDREVTTAEIQRHLTDEINRSAWVEWLYRHGIRL